MAAGRWDRLANAVRGALAGLAISVALAGTRAATAQAETPGPATAPAANGAAVDFFDPHRHMHVSEVKPGMTGYGLSVFHGTTRQRFDVEVISVLHDYNPKGDVVLIRCHGADLEHTGAIAGMSGSPVYLRDSSGQDRMIGAFAYGWPLAKDPLAGVQPIEYMLRLPTDAASANADGAASIGHQALAPAPSGNWSVWQAVPFPGSNKVPPNWPLATHTEVRDFGADRLSGDAIALLALATPLSASGLPKGVMDQFGPLLREQGLVLLAGGGGAATDQAGPATIAPGDSLVTPLLTGDAEMSALGTCTEVIGNRVWAFGHPFNNEGNIDLPFGSGEVSGIVPELTQSFKLGALTRVLGTLRSDRTFGIAGRLGALPPTVPIDVRIVWADGSEDQTYHFQAVLHPRFTPLLAALATLTAITGTRDLPQYHTLNYHLRIEFADGRVLEDDNDAVSPAAMTVLTELITPMMAASDNPFRSVLVRKVSETIRVVPEQREAEVLSVNVPRLKAKPGETVQAYVTYRPFHAAEATRIIDVPLPKDLPDGTYQLVVSGWQRFLSDEQVAEPFRFTAQNIDDVFDLLNDLNSLKRSAIYARLVCRADGVAIGRTAMPRLPSSAREVLMGAGRSDTTAFASSLVSQTPVDQVMDGAAEFELTVDSQGRGENGTAVPTKREPLLPSNPPANQPAPAKEPTLPDPGQLPGG